MTGLKEVQSFNTMRENGTTGQDGSLQYLKSCCKRDWSSFVALKSKIRADRGYRSELKMVQSRGEGELDEGGSTYKFPVIR